VNKENKQLRAELEELRKQKNIQIKLENPISPMENIMHGIQSLSFGTQGQIIMELNKNIFGCDWKEFIAIMQQILPGAWLAELRNNYLLNSINPSQDLFNSWSTRNSYTIGNLVKILKKMEHDKLLNLILSDISSRKEEKQTWNVQIL